MKKLIFVLTLLLIVNCWADNRITQISTIDALLAGAYDGQTKCNKLLEYGDFGIGTFDKLNGEMAILNGKIYQIKSDGKIVKAPADINTPFASVCKFKSDKRFGVSDVNFKSLESVIDERLPNQNQFLAIKITGTFKYMKVRSVPAQKKPYPPLVEVTKTQPVFEANNVEGIIIGFRSPPFAKGVNVTGYHFHFLSTDLKIGGHILDFDLAEGKCEIERCNELLLILPKNDSLENIDLSKDKTKELEKAEK